MRRPTVGRRVSVVTLNWLCEAKVCEYRDVGFMVVCDTGLLVFCRDDNEGVTWCRGWSKKAQQALMTAYTLTER